MVQFLRVLLQREAGPPAAVVVVNAGVRLLIDGSPALAPLQALEAAGVPIVACRSSVEHFDLEEELVVGDSTPMADLVEQLLTAESVIAL
jgi:intracellular sulfur oxidation DsrE/DsrF family protein